MNRVNAPVITIVGGGFSGSMVAVHLLKKATHPLAIKLIERQPFIGRGIAYSSNLDCHLLNVPAGKMSAFPDEPNHFLHWLNSRADRLQPIDANNFVPRSLYGKYIQEVVREAVALAPQGVYLERITDEAVSIKRTIKGAIVHLASGKELRCDRVVLALGNFPSYAPPVQNSSFYSSKRYLASFWSYPSLTNIASDSHVLLVGSGLTAVDAIATLHQQGHQGKIYVISRRGLLPQPHRHTRPYPPFLSADDSPKTIRALVRQVRQEIEIAVTQGYSWQAVIDSLRCETQLLWQSLPLAEKHRFLRHIQSYWNIHRHRIAPEIAQIISKMQDSAQLVFWAGRIQTYYENADGVDVVIRRRRSQDFVSLRAGVVINCTGLESNYRKVQHPLIIDLLASGFICPDSLGLGLAVAPNGSLIDADGKVQNRLFTLGSACRSCLWETTAVAEIRAQAKNLAEDLLKSVESNKQKLLMA